VAWAVELPFKKEILIMAKGILRLSVLEKLLELWPDPQHRGSYRLIMESVQFGRLWPLRFQDDPKVIKLWPGSVSQGYWLLRDTRRWPITGTFGEPTS